MSTYRRILTTLSMSLVLAASAPPSSGQTSPTIRAAMRAKLAATQELLEAVVRSDFDAIVRGTEPLSRISEAEIASWQTVERPDYVQHASLFLLSVKGLREAALERNVDAVALEYTTLIASCIRCHTYVRDTRTAHLGDVDLLAAAPRAPGPVTAE